MRTLLGWLLVLALAAYGNYVAFSLVQQFIAAGVR